MTTTTKGSRIPRILSKFNQYINTVAAFLGAGTPTANGVRLGLSAAQITQAQTYQSQWHSTNPATPGVYDLHTNPNTRTKATTKSVQLLVKDFKIFFNPLLQQMASSPAITPSDRLILNIAAPNPSKTKPQVPIANTVYFEAKPLGGGSLRVTCRVATDTKRASKPPGADVVQLSYKIGDPAPSSAMDASTTKENSTHASFILQLGSGSAGQKLYVYARWMDTKHPNLAGPWSPVTMLYVS
jgi:hypothetical protein